MNGIIIQIKHIYQIAEQCEIYYVSCSDDWPCYVYGKDINKALVFPLNHKDLSKFPNGSEIKSENAVFGSGIWKTEWMYTDKKCNVNEDIIRQSHASINVDGVEDITHENKNCQHDE